MDRKKPSQHPKGSREKLDGFYSTADSRRMHVTDYRTTISTISSTDSLPDDLNTFYACFETSSHTTERRPSPSSHHKHLITNSGTPQEYVLSSILYTRVHQLYLLEGQNFYRQTPWGSIIHILA